MCQAKMRTHEGLDLRCELEEHGDDEHRWDVDGGATISAVLHRADGTVVDLGEVARVAARWEAT